jgi:hypothetical protein
LYRELAVGHGTGFRVLSLFVQRTDAVPVGSTPVAITITTFLSIHADATTLSDCTVSDSPLHMHETVKINLFTGWEKKGKSQKEGMQRKDMYVIDSYQLTWSSVLLPSTV